MLPSGHVSSQPPLTIFCSSAAASRLDAGHQFIESFEPSAELLLVGETRDAVDDLARERAEGGSSTPEVDVIQLPIVNDRPSGVRFGSLVHAVLATVPLDGTVAPINLATLHGRMLGASETEVGAAATVVAAALAHPILKRADAAMRQGNCRREVPVAVNNEDGALTEGVVDLAFFERASDIDPGTWTVVDFKTDKELDVALDVYRRQVALYAEMVARATGQVAVPVLVRV